MSRVEELKMLLGPNSPGIGMNDVCELVALLQSDLASARAALADALAALEPFAVAGEQIPSTMIAPRCLVKTAYGANITIDDCRRAASIIQKHKQAG